jgi:hypothetical protein
MKEEDRYTKIVEALKRHQPVLSDRERMADRVMERILGSEERPAFRGKIGNYLFGWVDHGWTRRAMTVAAVLIIGIFVIQQISIKKKMNELEARLVTVARQMNHAEPGMGIMQKALLKMVAREEAGSDSITVSRSDLEELLNSYMELQDNYEILRGDSANRKKSDLNL